MDFDQEKLFQARDILKYLDIDEKQLPQVLMDDDSEDPVNRTPEEIILDNFKEDSLKDIKTVRFLKDFRQYNAGYDLKTSNESFLKIAMLYKKMGVKNYYFMLQLNNPLLIGVDPHSKDLTEEQKLMIHHECRQNFWYFLREVVRVGGGSKFLASRANIALLWSYLCHITTILIIPRQHGKQLRNSAKIKTPDGWTTHGEAYPGQLITMPDGTYANITNTYPQGIKDIYKITFEDGRVSYAGDEHLWNVWGEDGWDTLTTLDCKEILSEVSDQKVELSIPLVEPDLGPDKIFPIDPWTLGSSLNDECVIPDDYLEGSFKQRVAVLQGFLDKGGTVGLNNTIECHTGSLKLAEQIQYLVRSVGGLCTLNELITVENISENQSFELIIRHNKPWEFFTLPDKRDQLVNAESDLRLKMVSIKLHSKEEATCIEIDHPKHLYITDDFVVTHNTVSAQVIIFWLQYITGRGYESHLITLKDDNRSQFIEAIKTIRNSIPSWLTNVTYRDKDAGNSLSYSAFGEAEKNILRISVPQIGVEAARNVGRGLTIKTRVIDEPAYIKHMEAILNGAGPSTITARQNARRDGETYGTCFITTPASSLTESGKFMYDLLMGSTEWREPYFDCFNESHLNKVLIANSNVQTTSPTIGIVFNYMQLGRNKDWVKKTIDELHLSLSEAKIDLLLMWDDNGKGKLFDDATRDTLNNTKAGRQWSQKIPDTDLFFDWYISQEDHTKIITRQSGSYYGIGVDTSAAVNRDACTVIIRDLADGKLIGAGRYPLANLMDVGKLLETLLVEIEDSILVIERNYAHHMIDQLLRSLPALGLDPFKRIFNQIYQNPIKYAKEMQDIRNRSFGNRSEAFYLNYKQHFGFITNQRTREELYGFLQEAVGVTGDKIYYGKLIDEICELKEKNGRIDHDRAGHDDLVIAWLLTFWFMKLGDSKSEYGIPPGVVMTKMSLMRLHQGESDQSLELQEARANLYRKKIEELTEALMKTTDVGIIQRLELMIDKLQQAMPAETRKAVNIDDIKRNAKEARDRRQLELKRKRFGAMRY